MDLKPIGIFDSGFGGLTALRELEALAPGEKIIYLGDTGNVPYGGRSVKELMLLSGNCVNFLLSKGVRLILAACGTSSTTVLPELAKVCPVPLLGILEPASRAAVSVTKNGRVGVIATQATIASGAFERELKRLDPGIRVSSLACPALVPAIEAGHFSPGDETARRAAVSALEPLAEAGADTLILGCTHYKLMGALIGEIMGGAVKLIDSGAEAAAAVAGLLRGGGQGSREASDGGTAFFVSGETEDFARGAESFLGRDISQKVYRAGL